ncbi:MAG: cyclic nucleotide-binding domain-containing protein [Candidatus Acidiferrales bacterium]
MSGGSIRTIELDPRFIGWTLIFVQLLALITYLLGLEFLLHTSGGTLFLFSTATPDLILIATLALAGVALYRYLRRNSLFAFALFEPGDIVFVQGDQPDFAYFIQQGEVEMIRREGDVETVIARLGEGQHFGETSLMSNLPHHATIRATSRLRVAMLGKKKFLHMLRFVNPAQDDIMSAMNQRAATQASNRARSTAQSNLRSKEDQSG